MKLDRNINKDGHGKYALLNLRTNKIEWGPVESKSEFFVIKLRDRFSTMALVGYCNGINKYLEENPDLPDKERESLLEYKEEIWAMLPRSGVNNPFCKIPD